MLSKDYSRQETNSADQSGNIFESGSRSPRWRGGLDKNTRRNRAKTYAKYGIGSLTAANSKAASPISLTPDDLTIDNLISGKTDSFVTTVDTSTKKSLNEFIKMTRAIMPDVNASNLKRILDQKMVIKTSLLDKGKTSFRIVVTNSMNSGVRTTEIRVNRID